VVNRSSNELRRNRHRTKKNPIQCSQVGFSLAPHAGLQRSFLLGVSVEADFSGAGNADRSANARPSPPTFQATLDSAASRGLPDRFQTAPERGVPRVGAHALKAFFLGRKGVANVAEP
jgi:hypothetical protein